MKEPLTLAPIRGKYPDVNLRILCLGAVLAAIIPHAASGEEKSWYFPVCRHLSFQGNDGSHCMPATVTLKTEIMNAGQPFLVIGDRPSEPGKYPYYDLSMDVLLYYSIGDKLQTKTKDGEDQWRMNYAASVYWCLAPGAGSSLNPGTTPGAPLRCGSSHGLWSRDYQGRGTGGLPPDSVAQQILKAAMPSIAKDIPAVPPKNAWQGYKLATAVRGKKSGKICKEQVLSNPAYQQHISNVVAAELRGIAAPMVGESTAHLTLCDGNDLVLKTTLPETETRCTLAPPYDLSGIDTIAGNCAKKFGDELKSGTRKL